MALEHKGQDPIEAQGDGRQVSGRGLYIHRASGGRLEATSQPQADAFLRNGYELATPEEAREYKKDVDESFKKAREDNGELERSPVVETRLALTAEERQELIDLRNAKQEAEQKELDEKQRQAQPVPQTPEEAEEEAAKKQETPKDNSNESKKGNK